MNKNILIGIAILGMTTPGCNRNQNNSEEVSGVIFPDSIEMSWKYLAGVGNVPIPCDVTENDSMLYVLGMNKGHWIHVFDSRTGEFKGRYVTRGQEIGQLENAGEIIINNADNTIGVYDYTSDFRNDVKYFDKDFNPVNTFNVDSLHRIVHGIYDITADKAIVLAPSHDEKGKATHRVAVELISKKEMNVLSSFEGKESSDSLFACLIRHISMAPSKKAFAGVISRGGALELYKINGDSITRTFVNEYFPPQYIYKEGKEFPDLNLKVHYGFRDVAASDDYVYATYCDTKEEEPMITTIGVWDWNGNPVRKILTDKDIWQLTVSSDGKRLFCISSVPGTDNQLYYIDL